MNKVVIDTNLIVSAVRSRSGKPAKIYDMAVDGEITLYLSNEILEEYADVLSRPKHKLTVEDQKIYLDMIKEVGVLVNPKQSHIAMKDESDRKFYDAAIASGANLLTGDKKDLLSLNAPFILSADEYLRLKELERQSIFSKE